MQRARRLGRDRLTMPERALIKGVVGGKPIAQAALDAGYAKNNPKYAASTASQVLKKPRVMRALDRALDRAGAGIDLSANVIASAHGATETKVFNGKDGLVYSKPMIDHDTRLRAAELNLKARGLLIPAEIPGTQSINIGMFVLKGLHERGLDHLIDADRS